MPPRWFWIVLALCGAISLFILIVAQLKVRSTTIVFASYPDNIELGGVNSAHGQTTYRIVQWCSDPANPRPCPLVIHLPGGDLAGNALCDAGATAMAHRLGSPPELEIFPLHSGEKMAGVSIRLVPEGLPGVRPVAVSISGKRIQLPLTDDEAVQLLGEPMQRRILR